VVKSTKETYQSQLDIFKMGRAQMGHDCLRIWVDATKSKFNEL